MSVRTPLCILGSVLLFGASASHAEATCSAPSHYFDGARALNTTQYGASAYIDSYDPSICDSTSEGVAWTMETGSGGNDGWAQIGYGNIYGHWDTFTQWTQTYGGPYHTKTWPGVLSTAQYWVSYNFSQGIMYMNRGSSAFDQTTFDPAVYWTGPWIPEFSGETYNPESDVPGIASYRVGITSIQMMHRDGTWGNISSLALVTPSVSRYKQYWSVQPTSFQIYTDPP